MQLEKQLLESEDRAITAEITMNEIESQLEDERKKLEASEQKEKENEDAIRELEKQVKTPFFSQKWLLIYLFPMTRSLI